MNKEQQISNMYLKIRDDIKSSARAIATMKMKLKRCNDGVDHSNCEHALFTRQNEMESLSCALADIVKAGIHHRINKSAELAIKTEAMAIKLDLEKEAADRESRGIERRRIDLEKIKLLKEDEKEEVLDSLRFANAMKAMLRDRMGLEEYVSLVKDVRSEII